MEKFALHLRSKTILPCSFRSPKLFSYLGTKSKTNLFRTLLSFYLHTAKLGLHVFNFQQFELLTCKSCYCNKERMIYRYTDGLMSNRIEDIHGSSQWVEQIFYIILFVPKIDSFPVLCLSSLICFIYFIFFHFFHVLFPIYCQLYS